jgi:hypothetical protein
MTHQVLQSNILSEQVLLNQDIMSCVAEFIPRGRILPYLLVSTTTLNSWKCVNGNRHNHNLANTNTKTKNINSKLKVNNNNNNNINKVVSDVSEYCGSVSMLEWAIQANMPITVKVFWSACEYGNLDCVKLLRLNYDCEWDSWSILHAAQNCHLHVLQWLRSQDPPCPWDDLTCACAAANGHLHVLQWLRSQDPPCPWDREICRLRADSEGHLHIVQWIDKHSTNN